MEFCTRINEFGRPNNRITIENFTGRKFRVSLTVRVDDSSDDPGQHLAHLALVAPHQNRILERLLRQLAQLGEVLVKHLDLLDTGDGLALGRAPHRKFRRHARHRHGYLGGASPSPGFFCAPGCEKIIWPIRFSRLTGAWVNLMRPPGGIACSEPPGASCM